MGAAMPLRLRTLGPSILIRGSLVPGVPVVQLNLCGARVLGQDAQWVNPLILMEDGVLALSAAAAVFNTDRKAAQ